MTALTTWRRVNNGPAHVIVSAGSDRLVTACATTLPRSADALVTRWIADAHGYHTRPVSGEACAKCEDVATEREM